MLLVGWSDLVDEVTGGGRLAGVDVSDDDQVDVSLILSHLTEGKTKEGKGREGKKEEKGERSGVGREVERSGGGREVPDKCVASARTSEQRRRRGGAEQSEEEARR